MKFPAPVSLFLTVFTASLVSIALGCSDGPPFGDVSGQVTLDNKPVEGTIRFVPINGDTATSGSTIVAGRYEARVPVNQCKVQISAASPIPASVAVSDTTDVGLPEELIPACYNIQSELVLDVPEGSLTKDFELKSKQ